MEKVKSKLSDVIKELVEQISMKEISTKDFVQEMGEMYKQIDDLTQSCESTKLELESQKEQNRIIDRQKLELNHTLDTYKKEFVTPAEEYDKKEAQLEKKHYQWRVHKEYVLRENEILKIIIEQLTSQKTHSMYNGTGGSYSEQVNKMMMPKVHLDDKPEV